MISFEKKTQSKESPKAVLFFSSGDRIYIIVARNKFAVVEAVITGRQRRKICMFGLFTQKNSAYRFDYATSIQNQLIVNPKRDSPESNRNI